jgi:Domain of unknown function (DUF4396)
MVPTAALGRVLIGSRLSPLTPEFWFVMSMALLVGFIVAYPMNWWLVAKGLKHGMMTVRPGAFMQKTPPAMTRQDHGVGHGPPPSPARIAVIAAASVVVFALAIWFALAI